MVLPGVCWPEEAQHLQQGLLWDRHRGPALPQHGASHGRGVHLCDQAPGHVSCTAADPHNLDAG